MQPDALTNQFLDLCKDSHWNPPLSDVDRYVQFGIDVNYKPSHLSDSILHQFVKKGKVEHVNLLLRSQRVIDFTQRGRTGENVIHATCGGGIRDDATFTMLQSIVERIQTHPTDKVDWAQKDGDAMNILAIAADNQKLSLIWNIIVDIPYFSDHVDPFPLRPWVWSWDWEALGKDQIYFSLEGVIGIVETNRATAKLAKLCWFGDTDPSEVEELVNDGADLCFQQAGVMLPVLHQIFNTGSLACVESCLKTHRALDFTITDNLLNTPLHHICLNFSSGDGIPKFLHALLDRLERRPDDIIDWSLKNRRGDTFLSLTAKHGSLSTVWNILRSRQVSFFVSPSHIFSIKHLVRLSDWSSIKEEERKWFDLEKGIESGS